MIELRPNATTRTRQASGIERRSPAGRLAYDVMEWWVSAGSLAFPLIDHPAGDRRSMPDA